MEGRAVPGVALEQDRAVVLFCDTERDGEAETIAAQVGKVHARHAQRDEDCPELRRSDACAVVTDDDVCAVTLLCDGNVDAVAARAALHAVCDDVEQHPLDERRVERALDRRFRNVHVEHDAVVVGNRLYVFQQHPAFRAEVTQLRCECERPVAQPGGGGGIERKAQQPVIKPLEFGGIVAKVHITQLHAVIMEVRRERVQA